jgi:[CysO sulfur-carrier protein]-S-L-cysteine hydrolase
VALCERDPEREACGLVVRRGGALEAVPVENAADRAHARDPARFPRTGRDAYLMEPRALLRIAREVETAGGAILAVWHSHVEAAAAFSAQDRADALADGAPLWPGVEHLVLGLRRGRVATARRYRWADGAFLGSGLALPPRGGRPGPGA